MHSSFIYISVWNSSKIKDCFQGSGKKCRKKNLTTWEKEENCQNLETRTAYPYSELFWSVFSLNAGEYGPEKLRLRTLFAQCRTGTERLLSYAIWRIVLQISVLASTYFFTSSKKYYIEFGIEQISFELLCLSFTRGAFIPKS